MDAGATPILAPKSASEPIVAIALGSGGARGFAHIAVLEALDELGVAPSAIAGTSIGAMIGAAYAAGMSGREIRAYALGAVRSRSEMMGKLLRARVGRFSDLVLRGRGNPVLLDGEVCLDLFWPEAVPDFFEELAKPLLVVATDFYDRRELVMSSGALGPAVAGSMAIPGLIQPVAYDGRYLIDGGAVNPLPYDLLFDHADVVVAVDVTFGGRRARVAPSRPVPVDVWRGADHAGRDHRAKAEDAVAGHSRAARRRTIRRARLSAREPDPARRRAGEGRTQAPAQRSL